MTDKQPTIYYNPTCSKSRQTLDLLIDKGLQPKIIEYLDNPLSKEEIQQILDASDLTARDLLRTTEQIYKDAGMDEESLNDEEIIEALSQCPTLLQRPIVIANGKAALGRPPENVLKIL